MPVTASQLAALLDAPGDAMLVIVRLPIGASPRCHNCGRILTRIAVTGDSLFRVSCRNRACCLHNIEVTVAFITRG